MDRDLPRVRVNSGGVVRCEPEWSWHPKPDYMKDFDLWFLWAGRGMMQIDGRTIPLGPGSAFCLRPRTILDATHDPRHRLGVCYVHFDFLDESGKVIHPGEADLPPLHSQLPRVELYEQMLRHVVELFRSGTDAIRQQAASYLSLVIGDLRSASTSSPLSGTDREHFERISEVMRFVRENPGRIFSIAELAERAMYSVDHFTRTFTEVAGIGPKAFCIRARMERAQLLLRESAMTIEQIAGALGYADVFFFSRQFKQQFGVSPKKWRAKV